jgi:hypothetical protein
LAVALSPRVTLSGVEGVGWLIIETSRSFDALRWLRMTVGWGMVSGVGFGVSVLNSPLVEGWTRSGRGVSALKEKEHKTLKHPGAPRHPSSRGELGTLTPGFIDLGLVMVVG